ncbi:pilus assembly PilX family protein [Endozoicomonas euniceicola]|uniref:Pilus assembly protein n=1 Tax=Endozoicomonas euniceicola TaxID=1234143 RepID=A0ABY6GTC1_9GAMM|nr:pilus assembly protein [Endozoicomonas euniceicola]UYM15316.1 pilus assembly protein [Endozoicomonas euniceicola]
MHRRTARQNGAALLYTVVFMGLMAFAGLITMQSSMLAQKMSASYRNSQIAEVAAEAALLEAERCILNQTLCSDIARFNNSCTNGLCFTGTSANNIITCRAGNDQPWQDSTLWGDTTRTIASASASAGTSARYIIEFICYMPRVLTGTEPNPANPVDWSRVYRITALSTLDDANTHVMLQSTFKR